MFIYLILINAAGVLFMLTDKCKAQKGLWRIPEKLLLLLSVLGGSLGVLMGMQMFHHKTKKVKFTIGIPLILAVQIIAIILLYNT